MRRTIGRRLSGVPALAAAILCTVLVGAALAASVARPADETP